MEEFPVAMLELNPELGGYLGYDYPYYMIVFDKEKGNSLDFYRFLCYFLIFILN